MHLRYFENIKPNIFKATKILVWSVSLSKYYKNYFTKLHGPICQIREREAADDAYFVCKLGLYFQVWDST